MLLARGRRFSAMFMFTIIAASAARQLTFILADSADCRSLPLSCCWRFPVCVAAPALAAGRPRSRLSAHSFSIIFDSLGRLRDGPGPRIAATRSRVLPLRRAAGWQRQGERGRLAGTPRSLMISVDAHAAAFEGFDAGARGRFSSRFDARLTDTGCSAASGADGFMRARARYDCRGAMIMIPAARRGLL